MHTVVSSVTCHLVGELGRVHRKINLNTDQCLFSSKCTAYGKQCPGILGAQEVCRCLDGCWKFHEGSEAGGGQCGTVSCWQRGREVGGVQVRVDPTWQVCRVLFQRGVRLPKAGKLIPFYWILRRYPGRLIEVDVSYVRELGKQNRWKLVNNGYFEIKSHTERYIWKQFSMLAGLISGNKDFSVN